MEKVKKILEATKKFSKRQIDVSGKGRSIKRLEDGAGISETKINVLYQRVLELESETESKKAPGNKHRAGIPVLENTNKQTQEQLKQAAKRIADLEDTVKELSQKIDKITQYKTIETEQPSEQNSLGHVLGFKIVRKVTTDKTKSTGKVRRYRKLYAVRSIDGKQRWVYLGDRQDNAESKIKAYMERHNLSLDNKDNTANH